MRPTLERKKLLGYGMVSETIAFAGGGTGGHVSPAVALAEAFQSEYPEYSLIHFGGNRSEETLVDISYQRVDISPPNIQVSSPFKTGKGLIKSVSLVNQYMRNNHVKGLVATGGYVCFPSLISAILLKIPFWILEQNQIPGQVVRLFSSLSQGVFGPLGSCNKKVSAVGVPVRQEIRNSQRKKEKEERLKIVVCGGSQGASILDQRIPSILNDLKDEIDFEVFHFHSSVSSTLHYESSVKWEASLPGAHFVSKLKEADVVIGRAGGSTISECNALGIAQILIPLPFAKDNHQWHNARFQVESGAAIMVEEQKNQEAWLENIKRFLKYDQLSKAQEESRKLDRPQVANDLAEIIVKRIRR